MQDLSELIKRYDELMSEPNPDYTDAKRNSEIKFLSKVKNTQSKIESIKSDLSVACELEMHDEAAALEIELEKLNEEMNELLKPRDPRDDDDVIMEIRPAAGGDESALFAASLLRMYTMYATSLGFRTEIDYINETEIGGVKEVSFRIEGEGAYRAFKFESGVHRVQRVPDTETQGRIHTSTCTVAVLPEVQKVDFKIDEKDLRIDVYRSSGAGGQHVNRTESAVRITHLPTNTVVTCQDNRSQLKNRERAMIVLQSKLADYYQSQADAKYAGERKSQVGTGDRSERIRTYNFPQDRVTDHRIGFTTHNLPSIMAGNIHAIIDALHKKNT